MEQEDKDSLFLELKTAVLVSAAVFSGQVILGHHALPSFLGLVALGLFAFYGGAQIMLHLFHGSEYRNPQESKKHYNRVSNGLYVLSVACLFPNLLFQALISLYDSNVSAQKELWREPIKLSIGNHDLSLPPINVSCGVFTIAFALVALPRVASVVRSAVRMRLRDRAIEEPRPHQE